MNLAHMLYMLQKTELELAAKIRRLQEVQAALGETEELRTARAALEQSETELRRWQTRQRDLELEVSSLEQRIAAAEQQLMSGRVRNPKELEGMEANVQSLRHRRQQLEDELLEAMMSVDDWTTRRDDAQATYQQTEDRWRERQAGLNAEQEHLQQEIARLQAEREHLRERVGADALAEYERLRQRRGGYAVSEVQGGACEICGVTLSVSLVQEARQGTHLVYCGSCGRILYTRDG
ncbi:MAG: hypothetical protein GXP39_11945 [Chloroflexi bacterium]|nr:hypothetical protein [Chloroflexota bacterium]